jgi:hypothetical protein
MASNFNSDRGPWGDSSNRGNFSGYLVKGLILRVHCHKVFDPVKGSGTTKDVVLGINQYSNKEIYYDGRDLQDSWDIM